MRSEESWVDKTPSGDAIMNDILYMLGIALIFSSILFLAYMTTRYMAGKTERITRGKYLGIIDTISLGKDKHLHIVKAGDEFILVSSSGEGIEFICRVEINNYVESSENEANRFIFNNLLKDNIDRIKNMLRGSEKDKKEQEEREEE